jgi:PKD repeat protein
VGILFGDGGRTDFDCDHSQPGGRVTRTFTHTYNKPGRFTMLVTAMGQDCGYAGELYGSIDIGEGRSTAQGPSLPEVKLSESIRADDPTYQTVTLWGHGHDEDGYITKLVVSFGDGTTKTFAGDGGECITTRGGWPAPSDAWLPTGSHPYAHRYAKSGSYTLRLTAYSAGCNGEHVQTGTSTMTFQAGAWDPPSLSPSPRPSSSAGPVPSPTPTPSPTG